MEVILLQDIKGLGKRNDIKNVATGYARNFLLPKKLVEVATPPALKKLIEERTLAKEEHKKLVEVSEENVKKIQKLTLRFQLKARASLSAKASASAGEKKEVFGSVNAKDIERALEEQGFRGATAQLRKPIKTLGEQKVEIDLGEGVHAPVRVLIEAGE